MSASEILLGTVAEIPQAANKGGGDVAPFGGKVFRILGLGEARDGDGCRKARIKRTVTHDGGRTSPTIISYEILAID